MPIVLEQAQYERVGDDGGLPCQVLTVMGDQQVLQVGRGPSAVEQAEENGVDYARENYSTEVEDIQIVCLVELVLSKDSVEDTIAVVCMHNAFKEVLNGRNDRHMSRKEEGTVWQYCAEAAHDEEEELDDGQQDGSIDEFVKNDS